MLGIVDEIRNHVMAVLIFNTISWVSDQHAELFVEKFLYTSLTMCLILEEKVLLNYQYYPFGF